MTLITTRQVAGIRGVTVQAISLAVREGRLTPAITLDNGHYLWNAEDFATETKPEEWQLA